MKPHDWSAKIVVYESLDMIVCRGCGAQILAVNPDGNYDEDCTRAGLPINCDEAVVAVVNEEYEGWDQGPWDDDDRPEWGQWGTVYDKESNKHLPYPAWVQVWLPAGTAYPTYMEAWRKCQEFNR